MTEKHIKCPLCGNEIDRVNTTCAGCPMSRGCKMICCPNCGYSFPDYTEFKARWERLFNKKEDGEMNDERK